MEKSINELREEQIKILANLGDGDFNKAALLMSDFMRYTALRAHNGLNTEEEEEGLARLEKGFAEYGLVIFYYGIYPTIASPKGGAPVNYEIFTNL